MKKATDIEAEPLTLNECLTHKKPYIVFCLTHDTALCSLCLPNTHHNCKTIDYTIEFNLMYSSFSFQNLLNTCKTFCEHSTETLHRLSKVISRLDTQHNVLNKMSMVDFFDTTEDLNNFEEFCKGKEIQPDVFVKALVKKYMILFEEKYNEIYKAMGDLQREFKLLEANHQKILKLLEKGQNIFAKEIYERMSEINISSKKIVRNSNMEFKLKKTPIDKSLDFDIIETIIKDHIVEITRTKNDKI